jgi:hypothetical protein
MPVWPEVYEQKNELLKEINWPMPSYRWKIQEGRSKFNVNRTEDLTKVDTSIIAECDIACDKARMQMKLHELKEKNQKNKASEAKPNAQC